MIDFDARDLRFVWWWVRYGFWSRVLGVGMWTVDRLEGESDLWWDMSHALRVEGCGVDEVSEVFAVGIGDGVRVSADGCWELAFGVLENVTTEEANERGDEGLAEMCAWIGERKDRFALLPDGARVVVATRERVDLPYMSFGDSPYRSFGLDVEKMERFGEVGAWYRVEMEMRKRHKVSRGVVLGPRWWRGLCCDFLAWVRYTSSQRLATLRHPDDDEEPGATTEVRVSLLVRDCDPEVVSMRLGWTATSVHKRGSERWVRREEFAAKRGRTVKQWERWEFAFVGSELGTGERVGDVVSHGVSGLVEEMVAVRERFEELPERADVSVDVYISCVDEGGRVAFEASPGAMRGMAEVGARLDGGVWVWVD